MATLSPLSRAAWTATASSSFSGNPASNAIDGDLSTYWWSGASIPQSVDIDMGSAQTVEYVSVQPSSTFTSDRATVFEVWHSDDGSTFTLAASGSFANDATAKVLEVGSFTKRYFRVRITGSTGGWTHIGDLNAGVFLDANPNARATQAVVEALQDESFAGIPKARATQIAVEWLQDESFAGIPSIRATQVVLEILNVMGVEEERQPIMFVIT